MSVKESSEGNGLRVSHLCRFLPEKRRQVLRFVSTIHMCKRLLNIFSLPGTVLGPRSEGDTGPHILERGE